MKGQASQWMALCTFRQGIFPHDGEIHPPVFHRLNQRQAAECFEAQSRLVEGISDGPKHRQHQPVENAGSCTQSKRLLSLRLFTVEIIKVQQLLPDQHGEPLASRR